MHNKKGSQIDIAVLDFSKDFTTVHGTSCHDALLRKLKHSPPARVRSLATLPLIIQVPTNPLTLQSPPLSNNKALNKQLSTKSISSTVLHPPKHVNFTCKGTTVMEKRGLGCSYPHPPMCFKFINSGYKGCPKGDSCRL